jgi:DNA-binding CsgD family transcriptional regulator
MAGFTLSAKETSRLADIVETTRNSHGEPLPWPVLAGLKGILNADTVGLTSLDSVLPRLVCEQWVDPDGSTGVVSETAEESRDNPFWERYWDPERGCSYPDRTGDYDWVNRASDEKSVRQRRASFIGEPSDFYEHCLTGCLPGATPGRYSRLRAFRRGSDFTDRHVFYMTLLKPHVESALRRAMSGPQHARHLTRRQVQVLRLVQDGLTNRQIARRVGVSEGTVHAHLINSYTRLEVQSRTAAVQKAFGTADVWPAAGNESSGG